MIELIGTIATILAVTGVWLNNRKLRACFILFLFSNALALYIHVDATIWSVAVRDATFIVLAVEGWFKWRKKEKEDTEHRIQNTGCPPCGGE